MMEDLNLCLKSSNNRQKFATKVLTRRFHSPFHSSLASTTNQHIRSLSRTHKKSPIRARASPTRFTPLEKSSKQEISISTTASIKSKTYEEEQNIIKTPTTIHEDPQLYISIDDELRDYFYKPTLPKPSQVLTRPRHRYTLTTELFPPRSETPEIPTKLSTDPKKLPNLQKKVFKKQNSRSPSPYENRFPSRSRRTKSKLT